MKNNLYVVKDLVAEQSGPVFEAINDGIALRNYYNMLEKIPERQRKDYLMYCVGSIDHESDFIEPELRLVEVDMEVRS